MKKLLSAVTSLAMCVSLTTGAFASSIVSAAGGVSAVQPNVSMGNSLGVSANKTADNYNLIFPTDNIDDLIAANDEMHIEDNGDGTLTYYMDVAVDVPDTDLVAAIKITPGDIQVPSGVKYDGFETTSYATSMKAGWEKTGDYLYLKTLKGGSEPDVLNESEPLITLRFIVDKTFEGTVPVSFDDALICIQLDDANHTKVEYTANITAGSFTMGNATETTTTTAATTTTTEKQTTTTTAQQITGDYNLIFPKDDIDALVAANDQMHIVDNGDTLTYYMDVAVDVPDTDLVAAIKITPGDITVPSGVKYDGFETTSYATSMKAGWEQTGDYLYLKTLKGGSEPDVLIESEPLITLRFDIDKTFEGTVPVTFDEAIICIQLDDEKHTKVEYPISINGGSFTKGAAATTTSTAEATTTTTTKQTTTTTTVSTTAPVTTTTDYAVAEGGVEWIIPQVTAKAGEKVTMDIVVKSSDLAVAGASYSVTAADPIKFSSVSKDSAAYGSEIVKNEGTNEFAFGEGVGKGVVAEDGSVIMTLTYEVPAGTAAGKYPVEWSAEEVSDTNGNIITDKVTFTDGYIEVVDDAVEGTAEWVIPEVQAKPGETVTMDVVVKNSDLAVAGASYVVTAKSPIEFSGVSKTSDAYGSEITNNGGTNEFAFGEAAGKGVKAADDAVIMTLTYKVPEGTAAGKYPVEWSAETVSDTNGNIITDKVTFTNGYIEVIDDVAEGTAEWVIPQVKAKAGETVTMDVVVKKSDLAVAGASYSVNAASPIKFSGVSKTSEAYGSEITNNGDTNEFAFGEAAGKGVTAADDAVIMTLTYEVPAGTPAGKYPVEWSAETVSDTNGNIVTDKVTFTDGYIEVIDDTIEGEIKWVLDEKTAKPGETVELKAVVVDSDNAQLPIAGAQFLVTPDSPIEFTSVSKASDAYGSEIVNNGTEYAFGEGKGSGIAAKDGDVVAVFTYTVPEDTAPGDYPVKWSDAFICDTNGNPLTTQVTLEDGMIHVVDDKVTGDITWTIPEKEAVPGETVDLEVKVSVGEGGNLPVAGAQFLITAADPIGNVSGVSGSAPYDATIVNNATEFAFGQAVGKGIEAEDGSIIFTLTYDVPADIEPGKYPVTWSGEFISDTNGNPITEYVTFVDGAIIIPEVTTTTESTTTTDTETTTTTTDTETTTTSTESTSTTDTETTSTSTESTSTTDTETTTTESTTSTDTDTTTSTVTTTTEEVTTTTTSSITVAEGNVIWQVPTVTAEPGDTVTMDVIVIDPNDTKLPVGGAQFIATISDESIALTGISGSTGYGADVVFNGNEIAFAEASGKGIGAPANGQVVTLTYQVPEDIADGEYPVNLTSVFASDENGQDITSKIMVLPGAIVVKRPISTSTDTATTTTSDTTSTTSTETTSTESTETTSTTSGETTSTTSGETTSTTSTATTTTEEVTTTTTSSITVAEGNVIWQVPTVTAEPGDTVTMDVIVLDPNNTKLPVGGAQFIATISDESIALTGIAGSTGYGADVVFNGNEIAFAEAAGKGVAAPTNGQVVTLTYTVPENIADGEYPVNLTAVFASDENGQDITSKIMVLPGAIVIKHVTTTSTDTATTTSTDTTSTVSTETTSTESTETTSTDTTSTDTTSTTSTETTSTDTTSTESTETTSTETTSTETTSTESTETTSTETTSTDTTSTTSTETTSTETTSTESTETTSTETTSTDTTSTDTTETTSTETTSTESTETTSTDTTSTETTSTETTSTETTSTETTPAVTTTTIVAQGKTRNGYYFNHDSRTFALGHVTESDEPITLISIDEDNNETPFTLDPTKITFKEEVSGLDTPQSVFREAASISEVTIDNYRYLVNVYYDGNQLFYADGTPVTFYAYIGVKGDANLDSQVLSTDASAVLKYYAQVSTGKGKDDVLVGGENKLVVANPELDQLAAFLADVDKDVYSEGNWKTEKIDRDIVSTDASAILKFYALNSTTVADKNEAWNQAISGREESMRTILD